MLSHLIIPENKYNYVFEDNASESLVATNVDNIISLGNISDTNDKKKQPKISLFIINDRSTPSSKPYFAVAYHGDSSGKELEKDLNLITNVVQAYQDSIKKTHKIDIDDLIITGDFNVSILKKDTTANKITIDEDTVRTIITPAYSRAYELVDIALPKGLISKRRGGEDGHIYNLDLNAQPKKEKKLVENDSKEYTVHFKLPSNPTRNRTIFYGAERLVDTAITKLIRNNESKSYTEKNYLVEDTQYQDHAPADSLPTHLTHAPCFIAEIN